MKNTLTMLLAFAVSFGTVSAQVGDNGVKDTFAMELTTPVASGADYKLEARLYCWHDAPTDTIASMSTGWKWGQGVDIRLDSAKASTLASAAFNGAPFLYGNTLGASNTNNRIQSSLFRLDGDHGLPPTDPPSRQLIATWYFTLLAGSTTPDSIIIDTLTYSGGTVFKWVYANLANGIPHYPGRRRIANPLPVDEGDKGLPTSFSLAQNYPNPFNPSTTISFSLPERSKVTLTIYNVLGQEITRLEHGTDYGPGTHTKVWDGVSDYGHAVASGVYFYKLETANFRQTKKMLFLK